MKKSIRVIVLAIICLAALPATAQTSIDLVNVNIYKDSTVLNTPLMISGEIKNISGLGNVIIDTYKMSSGVKIQTDTLSFSHEIAYYLIYKQVKYGCSGKNFILNIPISGITSIPEERYLKCIVSVYLTDGTKASEKEIIIINK